jgi:hypothetical protein
VLAVRSESGFSGRCQQRRENTLMYWFSMGRQVQMRPVLASITDQLVAGTGSSVCSVRIGQKGVGGDTELTGEVCARS